MSIDLALHHCELAQVERVTLAACQGGQASWGPCSIATDTPMTAVTFPFTEPSRCKRLKAASSRDHDSVDQLVMAARPSRAASVMGASCRCSTAFMAACWRCIRMNSSTSNCRGWRRCHGSRQSRPTCATSACRCQRPPNRSVSARPRPWDGCIAVKVRTWGGVSLQAHATSWAGG